MNLLAQYLADANAVSINLVGVPSVSVPWEHTRVADRDADHWAVLR
jgi:Asp-tRNA(Asn)/Glu-tRNA(Gln) amidotransferase A subunit family amidase